MTDLKETLRLHQLWLAGNPEGKRANLSKADLRGANLLEADLLRTTLCGATIDGAKVRPEDIGGPGHFLCALTEEEWEMISNARAS